MALLFIKLSHWRHDKDGISTTQSKKCRILGECLDFFYIHENLVKNMKISPSCLERSERYNVYIQKIKMADKTCIDNLEYNKQ